MAKRDTRRCRPASSRASFVRDDGLTMEQSAARRSDAVVIEMRNGGAFVARFTL